MGGFLRTLAPYLAYCIISFVGWTSRIRYHGLEHLLAMRKVGRGYIYCFWHQRQVLFTYTHRDLGASVLVSRSRDGEIIAETMRLSRIGAVRGSSSRGGGEAALKMAKLLAEGRAVGLTPDGPKGPAREIKKGVLYLARKSGCPILPLTNSTSRKLVFRKSWDSFHVPLPFADSNIYYGHPVHVGPDDDLDAKARELESVLNEITEKADRLVETR
ncbi:MAG: lysophospholipid acyltransferase family protein [Elusimicrobiota bacterium]